MGIDSGVTDRLTLSVLTPSFNYSRFIGDAIKSISAQKSTFVVEQLIQDAGSRDGTVETVSSIQTEHKVRFFSEHDAGQSDGLNKAIEKSSSNYIGWLNADEFYLEGAFQAVERAIKKHPEAIGFYGDCVFVDENGQFIRLLPGHKMSRFVLEQYGCFISSCTTFLKRDLLPNPTWDTSLRRAMDWDLWLRLSKKGKMIYIPEALSAFRVHGAQVTNTPESQDLNEFERIFEKNNIKRKPIFKLTGKAIHMLIKAFHGKYLQELSYKFRFSKQKLMWW